MGHKTSQASIAQRITRCNSALKIGYKCLEIGSVFLLFTAIRIIPKKNRTFASFHSLNVRLFYLEDTKGLFQCLQNLHVFILLTTRGGYCSVNVACVPSAAFGAIQIWKSPGSAEKVYAPSAPKVTLVAKCQ